MPCYDVECATCGFVGDEIVKLADLAAWDVAARCPTCGGDAAVFRRVIRQAPMSRMGGEGSARSELARKSSAKAAFRNSSEKADMLARNAVRVSPEQKAACIEGAKKGF